MLPGRIELSSSPLRKIASTILRAIRDENFSCWYFFNHQGCVLCNRSSASQYAGITSERLSSLLLEGQDQLAAMIGNRIGASEGSVLMTSAEGLITSLTSAFQQFPASHVEAALSAAKAVSTAVHQINAATGNSANTAAVSGSVGQQTASADNAPTPHANAA